MKVINWLLTYFLILSFVNGFSQSEPFLNNYLLIPSLSNAASIGMSPNKELDILYRKNYSSSNTQAYNGVCNFHLPAWHNKIGLQVLVTNGFYNSYNNSSFNLSFNYKLRVSTKGIVGAGIRMAYYQLRPNNLSSLHPADADDPFLQKDYFVRNNYAIAPSLFYKSNNLQLGYTISYLFKKESVASFVHSIYGKYTFIHIKENKLNLIAWTKYTNSQALIMTGVLYESKELYEGGLFFRNGGWISSYISLPLNKITGWDNTLIKFTYIYDFSILRKTNTWGSNHELCIRFIFKPKRTLKESKKLPSYQNLIP